MAGQATCEAFSTRDGYRSMSGCPELTSLRWPADLIALSRRLWGCQYHFNERPRGVRGLLESGSCLGVSRRMSDIEGNDECRALHSSRTRRRP